MEPITAAFGAMVAIPEAITAAKELYDLRGRFKDASVLITAIYSESLVVATSLDQIQSLLQKDALRDKPQLYETFDKAVTACRVVYGCLKEEVRELTERASSDTLRRRDRARYLLKEGTFKELLQQIRGQQSALSLLIQGLQMESIADIKQLVHDNSAKLDQVAKRSRTLRQSHPRLTVPDSIFNQEDAASRFSETDTLVSSNEAARNEEILGSRAYQRALASAALRGESTASTPHVASDSNRVDDTPVEPDFGQQQPVHVVFGEPSKPDSHFESEDTPEEKCEEHAGLLDSLDQNMLPFMPPTSSRSNSNANLQPPPASKSPPSKQSACICEPPEVVDAQQSLQNLAVEEDKPRLPPRKPSRPQLRPEVSPSSYDTRFPSDEGSVSSSSNPSLASLASTASTASSGTVTTSTFQNSPLNVKVARKPLPTLSHKPSSTILGQISPDTARTPPVSGYENLDMHNVWTSLIEDEQKFLHRMDKFRTVFYDRVVQQWPALEKHLEVVPIGSHLAALHETYILSPMQTQISRSGNSTCDASIFDIWTSQVQRLYRNYSQRLPHAEGAIRRTQTIDPNFSPFVDSLGLSIMFFGKRWDDYLSLPIAQLQLYVERLEQMFRIAEHAATPPAPNDVARIRSAIDIIQRLRMFCLRLTEDGRNWEHIQSLKRRIQAPDINYTSHLGLDDPLRRVWFQGGFAMKVNGCGPWHAVHLILLDNYFVWGKLKPPRSWKYYDSRESVWVLESPIPLSNLEYTLPQGDVLFQKATMRDDVPRGTVLYHFSVKDRASASKPHLFGAYTFPSRQEYITQLNASVTGGT